jgi:hypothetical protein
LAGCATDDKEEPNKSSETTLKLPKLSAPGDVLGVGHGIERFLCQNPLPMGR